MKTGTLANGFQYEIDEVRLDDMRLVDALVDAQEDDPLQAAKAITLVLGKEQKKRLYEYIAVEDGRVPVAKAVEILSELFEHIGDDGKN